MMMKTVLKVGVNDDQEKKKVMVTVCWLSGVDSISMDMKDKKLTVIGDIDPVTIVIELRKLCHTEIVSVGPAKEPEKPKPPPEKPKEPEKPKQPEKPKEPEKPKQPEKPKEPEKPKPPRKKEQKIEQTTPDKTTTDEVSALVKSYKE